MKIAAITDIHGSIKVPDMLASVISKADLVLLTGDITHFGHRADAEKVVSVFQSLNARMFCVAGNCDHPDVHRYLTDAGLNLHGRVEILGDVAIAGLGGSLTTPFSTPSEFSEAEYEVTLEAMKKQLPEEMPVILVSHHPPLDTACDRIRSGDHVGSRAVRGFIETVRPVVCFSGHIHESAAIDHIGETVVINPGPLSDGGVALFDTCAGRTSAEIYGYVP